MERHRPAEHETATEPAEYGEREEADELVQILVGKNTFPTALSSSMVKILFVPVRLFCVL